MAFLHVVDPVTEDPSNKLCKVESFVASFRARCQQLFQPSQNIAVDERMVKSRNRSGIRQFIKDKPTKWGILMVILVTSRFIQGRSPEIHHSMGWGMTW